MKYKDIYWKDADEVIGCIPNVDKLFGKSVLITGATGLICSTIVDLLLRLNESSDRGITVICAGRSEERLKRRFPGFDENTGPVFTYYDATKDEEIAYEGNIDYIIHGASNANPAIYMKEPVETMMSNILGLKRMLDLAKKKHAERLLYISSSEVYGTNETTDPYSEGSYGYVDILNPRAAYPSSKRAGETLCIAYGEEYGTDAVMVRPGHVYGPSVTASDNRASSEFTRKALDGEDIIMKSKGTQLRSYCHTLDCASAILTVLLNGERGNAYNISNPDSICTIADIAKAIADAGGVELRFSEATDSEKRSFNMMSNSSLRSDKLEALGWKACFPLQRGVKETIEVLK